MSERLRCAVIGAGAAGMEWIARLMRGPRTTVVAVCDPQAQRAREVSERYRIPRVYTQYAETVEQPDIEAVVVAAPNHLHAPVALAALKARKHVLVETPLALNLKEAARLCETAAAAKRLLMPAQELRFLRAAQAARACIQHGELGEVYQVRAFWRQRHHLPRPGCWRAQRAQAGGGCLLELGQPLADLALHLLGDFQVAQVSASGQTRFGLHGAADHEPARPGTPAGVFDVEDVGAAFLQLTKGAWVTLETGWAGHFDSGAPEQGLEIMGAKGSLSLFPARLHRPGALGFDTTLLTGKSLQPEDSGQHFAQCVLENKKPLVTPAEALAVQRVMDAVAVSAASGKPVSTKNG